MRLVSPDEYIQLTWLPPVAQLQGWNRLTTCDSCSGTDTTVLLASQDLWLSDPTTFINKLDPNTGITMQQVAVRGSPENCCELLQQLCCKVVHLLLWLHPSHHHDSLQPQQACLICLDLRCIDL